MDEVMVASLTRIFSLAEVLPANTATYFPSLSNGTSRKVTWTQIVIRTGPETAWAPI
jgi:hypothetical protein